MNRSTWSRALALAFGTLAAAASANAQFTDNFDSYSPGTLCPQGGWEEWVGSVDVCGLVSADFAFSGTQSLKIVGNVGGSAGLGDDTVQRLPDLSGGVWEFSAQTFVPVDAVGAAYVLLLNTYDSPPGAPIAEYRWSVQIRLDAGTNLVTAEAGLNESVPLIRGEWVQVRVVIDLDADLVDIFYNGAEFASDRSWINGVSAGGQPRIQAIDIYGNEPSNAGTSGTYFDDVSLVRQGGPACACDWNTDDALNSQDFFDFLVDFFSNNADFNNDNTTNSQDYFDFITCFFAPPTGC